MNYLVTGPPGSGKTTKALELIKRGQVLADRDLIWRALTGLEMYDKPPPAWGAVEEAFEAVLESIERGKATGAVVLSTPHKDKWSETSQRLGAEIVFVDVDIDTAKERILNDDRRGDKEMWFGIVDSWFDDYSKQDQRDGRKNMKEKRIYQFQDLEVREAVDNEPPQIRGYAAVFNQRSVDLGGFVEEIAPGAFRDSLATDPDVRATIDHSGGVMTLGRTRSHTLRLWEDDTGLGVAITPPDTQAGRDMMTLLRRGDVDQMSFSFRVPEGGDEWRTKDGETLRRLNTVDIDDGDVSIVTYPAYPQTSAEARAKVEELSNIPGPDEDKIKEAEALKLRTAEARKRQIEILKRKIK